jgi:hypothetical protein
LANVESNSVMGCQCHNPTTASGIGAAILLLASALLAATPPTTARARDYHAGPDNFRRLVKQLKPGDRLHLRPGTYTRQLPIHRLTGEPGRPIVIEGPAAGEPARFVGRTPHPLVSILDSAHITVRHLELDGNGKAQDGVKAEGHARWAHHITLEYLRIHGLGDEQQKTGISTKCPAWGWTLRGNTIFAAGTGIYLGNSDGSDPFVAGLIESNLVHSTLGYNLQIKHQAPRPDLPGLPTEPSVTRVRRNVFGKAPISSRDAMARPNMLVGHWPPSGPGRDDLYDIHANLFYANPSEVLFQGEGNFALHDNLFINPKGSAIAIQPHNDVPRRVLCFHNTVLATGTGIALRGGDPRHRQHIRANAVFAATPLRLPPGTASPTDNLAAPREQAARYLNAPDIPLSALDERAPATGPDLYPRPGRLHGAPSVADIDQGLDWRGLDFNGRPRRPGMYGAYGGEGQDPGGPLSLSLRPPAPKLFP